MLFSFDYIVAGLAAIPYLLFTDVNYIDNPIGSGNFLNESAFCALLDPNIYPQVFFFYLLCACHYFKTYPFCALLEANIFQQVFVLRAYSLTVVCVRESTKPILCSK